MPRKPRHDSRDPGRRRPPPPPWERPISRWLDTLAAERGLSGNTVVAYRRDLERLARDLAGRGGALETADAPALSAHLRRLRKDGLAPRSVRRALSSIRSFYAHLVTEGERADDPAVNLLPPRLLQPLPKVLSERQVEALLSAPDVGEPRGLRDRAMIEILYASGLRVSELVGLKLGHLQGIGRNREGRREIDFLLIPGKGAKERVVPIGEQAVGWLERYLAEVRPELVRGRHEVVFVNRLGAGLTRQGFWKILKGYARDARHPRRLAARPAPQLRHPPARARRRPARGADDARPRRHLDDADLHPHPPGAAEVALRRVPSAGVSRGWGVDAPPAVTIRTAIRGVRAHESAHQRETTMRRWMEDCRRERFGRWPGTRGSRSSPSCRWRSASARAPRSLRSTRPSCCAPCPGWRGRTELLRVYPGSETVSYPDYVFYRDHNQSFSGLVAEASIGLSWARSDRVERLVGAIVTGGYFRVLGVEPVLGRTFAADEDRLPDARAVAVIGYGLWQRAFAGDPEVVGRSLVLDGRRFAIVGVAPREFTGGSLGQAAEVWVPMMMQPTVWPGRDRLHDRTLNGLYMTGRIEPGRSREAVAANVDALYQRLRREHPETIAGWEAAVVEPAGLLHRGLRGPVQAVGALLVVVVALVLLIACANLGALLLAQASGRDREIAVRRAMGASRWRIVRRLLVESTLLSLAGGVVGAAVALALIPLLVSTQLAELPVPVSLDLSPHAGVLVVSLVLALLTGALFGLAPALRVSRGDLVRGLKDAAASRGAGSRRFGGRGVLVAGQIGLSLLLLIGAGLFVRSLQAAQSVDPGFRVDDDLIAELDLGGAGFDEGRTLGYFERLRERLRELPAVRSSAFAALVPLTLENESLAVSVGGVDRGQVYFNRVSPGYFGTLGIDLLEGRDFTPDDGAGAAPVAIVSRTMARRFWPGESALGKDFRQLDFGGPTPPIRVVGVAEDSKYLTLGEDFRPLIYLPLGRTLRSSVYLHVRVDGRRDDAYAQLLPVLREVDPGVAAEVRPAESYLGVALLLPRIGASLLGLFGVIGLLLTAIGVYGLMACVVHQRRYEIGVRIAVGGGRGSIVGLVVGQGMRLAAAGMAVGLAVSLLATRLLSGLLYGVSPTDPAVFLGVLGVLALAALAATWVPARRAARLDPIRTLRT